MSNFQIFFLGAVSGGLLVLFFTVMVLRWGYRQKSVLIKLISEIYHIDLLPFICRVEGLLTLIIMEADRFENAMLITYAEIALKEVRALKANIIEATKRYENYQ